MRILVTIPVSPFVLFRVSLLLQCNNIDTFLPFYCSLSSSSSELESSTGSNSTSGMFIMMGAGGFSRHRDTKTVNIVPTPIMAITMGSQTRGPRLLVAQSRKKASMALMMTPDRKKGLLRGWYQGAILVVVEEEEEMLVVLILVKTKESCELENEIRSVAQTNEVSFSRPQHPLSPIHVSTKLPPFS
ncbi:hypothetical protein KCU65_g392, partial [Aureobasidium melanogenum]